MRLWHKDLLLYLPRQQLQGQWRELNSIYKLQNKHILINFVYKDMESLLNYSIYLLIIMKSKGYRYKLDNICNYFKCSKQFFDDVINTHLDDNNNYLYDYNIKNVFNNKMNSRYLKQCLYNLQEKYDCGGIPEEEWQKIENEFKGVLNDE